MSAQLASLPPLAALLAAQGAVRDIAGNTPFLLDQPDQAIVVLDGAVDIFMVQVVDDQPSGVRQHVFTVQAGELMFGVDASFALLPVGLLAVGQVGTSIASFPLQALRTASQQVALRAELAYGLERWVYGLSDAMSRPIVPRPAMSAMILPGEKLTLKMDQRLGCVRGVAWVRPRGVAPLFLDSEVIGAADEPAVIPLSPASWITTHVDCEVDSIDTLTALENDSCWAGLLALHAVLLDIVPLNLRLAAVDELNRLRSRADADLRAARQAIEYLAEPLATLPDGHAAATDDDDPLVRAMAQLTRALGHALRVPARRRDQDDVRSTVSLDDILKFNKLRARRILLKGEWWRADAGPFLLRRASDDRPLALIPRGGRGRYTVYDPVEERTVPLSRKAAAALAGEAWSLSVPLPVRPLSGRDIGGNVLRWAPSDALAILGFGAAGGVMGLGVPIATGFLIDTVIPSYDQPKLWQMAVLLLIAAAVTLVTRYAVQIASVRIEGRAGTRMQAAVMDRILRLPVTFFRDFNAGDLAKRSLAIRMIEQAISGSVISSLMSGVFALMSLCLMFYYSPKLAAVASGLILLLALITAVIGFLRIRHERDVMKTSGETAGLLLQLAGGVAKLRLAAAEDRAFLRWSRLYGGLTRQRVLAGGVTNASALVEGVYASFATALVFGIIYWLDLSKDGGMPLGSLLAFLSAFGQAMAGMTALATTAVNLFALKPVYAFAAPILEATPEVDDDKGDPGVLTGGIEVSHLNFRYAPDAAPVFSDLSLEIKPGEYVAVVGPSGSGKSTLIRLLLGFEKPQAGAVLYDGLDLAGLDMQAVRRQFGVVLQDGKLMPGTLQENILGAHIHMSEADAWRAADQVGLGDDVRAMPMGMQTVITDAGSVLSGGQVQRVLIARALVAEPRVLLFDEATSALDNRTQSMVTDTLGRLNSTRIVIAHRLSTVVMTDRIIVMKDGAVVETGSYEALMQARGLFHDLAQRQLV